MGLDIRLPIGIMFALIGAILTLFGLLGDQSVYSHSLGYNVNLWWGIVLFIFGIVFTHYGRRAVPPGTTKTP
jgi:hypothetical protein